MLKPDTIVLHSGLLEYLSEMELEYLLQWLEKGKIKNEVVKPTILMTVLTLLSVDTF